MKTILLIEDNQGIRENTAEILEMVGYKVQTAENGKIGVEKSLINKPDLVICDVMMPILDGYGVLQIFNTNPKLSNVPFIFLTAKTDRNEFRKGMDLGADDYITKPFEESELLSAIESRLKRVSHLKANQEEEASMPINSNHVSEKPSKKGNLQRILSERKIHTVKKKQYIYMEGDNPTRLFYIKSGQVKTVRANADGKEFITGIYNGGDFLGYTALFDSCYYIDSAVALVNSELIYIPRTEFEQLLLTDHEMSEMFVKLLAYQVEEREQQLLVMAYNSLRRRVADTLLRLQNLDSDKVIQLSRDDLAAMVGTATESLIRTLSEFKLDGLIEMSTSGGIHILHPDKLRRAHW